jgi:FkbM family methyltransferase
MAVKDVIRQAIPYGICEYSVRRHEYIRLGLRSSRASLAAMSPRRYRELCEARFNLFPSAILAELRTCVDAGAHAGNWMQALLSNFNPNRVIAVECEPRLVEPLKARFNSLPSVVVVDAALADGGGTATFHQLRHPAGSSLLKPRTDVTREFAANSWDVVGTVDVRKISYDELVSGEDEVSILKLDIQGAEPEVLRNSLEGLAKTKSILMEVTFTSHYENDSGFPELHNLMAGKGFGLYRLSPPYHRGGRILYADALYIREEIIRNLNADGKIGTG